MSLYSFDGMVQRKVNQTDLDTDKIKILNINKTSTVGIGIDVTINQSLMEKSIERLDKIVNFKDKLSISNKKNFYSESVQDQQNNQNSKVSLLSNEYVE